MDIVIAVSMIGLLVMGLNGLVLVGLSRKHKELKNQEAVVRRMIMKIKHKRR